ncbi:MAG: CDP-diacylglycerol--serine O-phosphatidyltransferase [Gemmatimonadaceae bacterium]
MLPNGATLLNLFFGIFAIVSAARGSFGAAGWFVVLGGVADALDGRIARATGTGSRFGEELDSLVDAISVGLAPALIMYFAILNKDGWDWLFVFMFTSSAVVRLARFNVEQAGRKKTHFRGLPSPVAGMTLATYYWFSQTALYNETVIFFTDNKVLADFPWHVMLRFLMVGLALLMISNIPYPAVPTIGYRSPRQVVSAIVVVAVVLGLRLLPNEFFFPVLLAYVVLNAGKWALLGFFDRVPTGQSIFLDDASDDAPLPAGVQHGEYATGRRRRRRGRHRPDKPTPLMNPAVEEPPE